MDESGSVFDESAIRDPPASFEPLGLEARAFLRHWPRPPHSLYALIQHAWIRVLQLSPDEAEQWKQREKHHPTLMPRYESLYEWYKLLQPHVDKHASTQSLVHHHVWKPLQTRTTLVWNRASDVDQWRVAGLLDHPCKGLPPVVRTLVDTAIQRWARPRPKQECEPSGGPPLDYVALWNLLLLTSVWNEGQLKDSLLDSVRHRWPEVKTWWESHNASLQDFLWASSASIEGRKGM
jgi:hypothetical protein